VLPAIVLPKLATESDVAPTDCDPKPLLPLKRPSAGSDEEDEEDEEDEDHIGSRTGDGEMRKRACRASC
jgi:hypothetical protein